MKNITFSKDKVSFCHKNNCINVKGDIANFVTFSIALLVVVSGISALLESSK